MSLGARLALFAIVVFALSMGTQLAAIGIMRFFQ